MDLKFIVYLNSMVLISPSSSTPRVRLLQLPCRQVVLTRVSAAARFPMETPRLQGGFVVGRSCSFILIPGGLKGVELGLPYFDRRDGRTSAKGTCSGGGRILVPDTPCRVPGHYLVDRPASFLSVGSLSSLAKPPCHVRSFEGGVKLCPHVWGMGRLSPHDRVPGKSRAHPSTRVWRRLLGRCYCVKLGNTHCIRIPSP